MRSRWRSRPLVATAIALAVGVFALEFDASEARSEKRATVTLNLLAYVIYKPAYDVLIANFERVYPNVTINATYAATGAAVAQLTATELAAGNGPDLFTVNAGSDATNATTELARAGYLAPMVHKKWTRWSLPTITSSFKYGQGLFGFPLALSFQVLFTNDDLFRKLGLQMPQTFSQLLALCQRAKALGTIPLLVPAQNSTVVEHLLEGISLTTVYTADKQWNQEAKAGKTTFAGTAGWHAALQELVEMNDAGCLGPAAAGTSSVAGDAQFAQGQALMLFNSSSHKSTIDAGAPEFSYSMRPFPAATAPGRSVVTFAVVSALGVNAHASAQNQEAAQEFIDFIARPKQDALAAGLLGAVTQYQFIHGQLPSYLAGLEPALTAHQYNRSPGASWWNAGVAMALNQYGVGLITGQTTVDQVLQMMDGAWKQGAA
jgi:raffinose/stachyose/melibiose transport system substrate-binding protein